MSVLGIVREYLKGFPQLSGKRVDIDCLANQAGRYSVDSEPAETMVTRYLDGSSVRRLLFTVASREYFGDDIQSQNENIEFFERFEAWLERQAFFGRLPQLGAGRQVRSLRASSSAHPVQVADNGTARYQMICELIYLQEANYHEID